MSRYQGDNPFGGQSKMLLHLDCLYKYIYEEDTYPFFLEINLTSKCQLGCEWCISANFNRKDTIKSIDLIRFLREFKRLGGKAVTFSGGGEPTLHPDFEEITLLSKNIGLDLGLMTNGVYPEKYNKVIGENYDWVRFSLDTVNHKKYKKWKGIDKVDHVIKNITSLKKYKVKVGINCNIFKEHTLDDIKELCYLMPDLADYLQFRPVLPRYFEDEGFTFGPLIWYDWLENYKVNRPYIVLSMDKVEDLNTDNLFPFRSCEGHFFNPILDANGNLCVCMYHPDDDRFVFGNIYKSSLKEIWNSDRRQSVIDFIRKLNYKKECQVCCKLTEINKLLDFINHPEEGVDIHFL